MLDLVSCGKIGYIYCSDTCIHGSSNKYINDLCPVGTLDAPTPPPELVAWRPGLEQLVLASNDVLDVMVIRPALVYGQSGAVWISIFELLYKAAQDGNPVAELPVETDARPGLIHVDDDVATDFHAAVDKLPLLAGTGVYPVYDLATSHESMQDNLAQGAKTMGFGGKVQLVGAGSDLFLRAMSTSGILCSERARHF